jgi:hypothetical protein
MVIVRNFVAGCCAVVLRSEVRWRYGRDRLVVDVGPHVVPRTLVAAGMR